MSHGEEGAAPEAREIWDAQADTFDQEADHGLGSPRVRAAWAALMEEALGPRPLRIADLGCGTGSLSLLLRELGHDVVGLDVSPRMLEKARQKCGPGIEFVEGDAARPELPPGTFDVVLCRHVLWALARPQAALARWAALLRPGGTVCLIEGVWHTGAGLSEEQVRLALPSSLVWKGSRSLSGNSLLWGGPVTDCRFLVTAEVA